jgi:Domain of unknown function (DUF4832)/Domain of unknown function (DUF4874)
VLAACLGACDDAASQHAPADFAVAPDLAAEPTTTLSFTEQAGDVLNPERGWFGYTAVGGAFDGIRDPSDPTATPPATLAVVKLDLDQTQAQIPQATLDALVATAAAARAAGVKIVLRPLYRPDDSVASGVDPTSVPFVVSHVQQLAATLTAQADVIAVVQMGMLGPWGEFHSTPLVDTGAWPPVLTALLAAVPASRMIQVRRPVFKDQFFAGRGPLTAAEAFSGADVARVGHFNDCFLANALDDEGTFVTPAGATPTRTVDEWRAWAAADTAYTFVGGETCGDNARASCPAALADLAQFHWSFLGSGWYQPTVGPTGALAACRDEITRRLGYRLILEQADVSASVHAGGALALTVRLRNDGFAAPMNPRQVVLVLHAGATRYSATLDTDPRGWLPGMTSTFSGTLPIPAAAAPGTYSLSLWLPDSSPSLAMRPEYATRFANENCWDPATGFNTLTTALELE